jgi:hypothetical protein
MELRMTLKHDDELYRVLGYCEVGANPMMMLAGERSLMVAREQVRSNVQRTFKYRSGKLYWNWQIGDPEAGWKIDQNAMPSGQYRSMSTGRFMSQASILGAAGSKMKLTLYTDTVYARIQELGGTIVPKKAKVLAWKGDDGEWHFAMKVRIPARPYFRPAFTQASGNMDKAFAETVELYVQRKIGPRGWVK